MPQFRFPKKNKLYGRENIGQVFAHGQTVVCYPLQFKFIAAGTTARIMVSAPKRRFKRAVTRNRLKRLMREAYRLNQHILTADTELNTGIMAACFYIGPAQADFNTISQAMVKGLQQMARKCKAASAQQTDHEQAEQA